MKFSLKLAALMFLLLPSCKDIFAQGWRGIMPGRSTRTDVVRLLNRCSERQEACDFKLENEQVYILFSSSLPRDFAECAQRLPAETVMFIDVGSSTVRKLSDLHLNKKKLKTFNPTHPYKMGYKAYFDGTKGMVIQTFKGKVMGIHYIATQEDKLFCPAYYDPIAFAEVAQVHVPVSTVSSSVVKVVAGQTVVFSTFSNMGIRQRFLWTVSAGKIIAGQNTDTITLDTTGLAGQLVTATAEIRDNYGHAVSSSSTIQVLAP